MFGFFRKKRINQYVLDAQRYVNNIFVKSVRTPTKQIYENYKNDDSEKILYSSRNQFVYSDEDSNINDKYNSKTVDNIMYSYSISKNAEKTIESLSESVNQTFVDRLLYYIGEKGLRNSEVYKAAQIDKRLFSKIVSDREYKPSKDTAIALALALKLSLNDANDFLSRAGYTFSHSSKRDVIIEFFFRNKIYNLMDINEVLHILGQKLIGHT